MNRKRYRELFEVHTTTDPHTGKTRRQATYTGPYYTVEALETSRAQWGARMAPGVVVFLGVLLGYLLTDLPSTHYFLVLPFALAMPFPLFYWAWGVVSTLRLPHRFTEVRLDESIHRAIRSAYGLCMLCGLFAVGEAVLMATGGAGAQWPAETIWTAAMLGGGGLAWFCAAKAKKLDALKTRVP